MEGGHLTQAKEYQILEWLKKIAALPDPVLDLESYFRGVDAE